MAWRLMLRMLLGSVVFATAEGAAGAQTRVLDDVRKYSSGDALSLAFAEGSQNYRVDAVSEAPYAYRWSLYSQAGTAWSPVFALTFLNER
jgi:hypothetical protein